ncbi:MAG: S1 family peptidase [Gemmatimonadetes bacterium]|nr:S1 family peptidase [Gemmatimonadota bacterium]
MTPRKNLILALVIAGMAYLSFHLMPRIALDWHGNHADRPAQGRELARELQDPIAALASAMEVQSALETDLFAIAGVVGAGIGFLDAGSPVIKVFVEPGVDLILPQGLDFGGLPVEIEPAGPFTILPPTAGAEAGDGLSPNSRFERPVPMGVSTGHTKSTAGTIGAVVTDGSDTYALSNWHVFVPGGQGRLGDELLQPGPIDGGVQPADVIGTLAAFEPVLLSPFADNRIDAAIARTDQVMPRTPANGYGAPRSETIAAKPGLAVKKYGRTTGLTFGEVDAVNASINVNYGSAGSQLGRFTGQVVLCCDMSQGGDSGSLIVAHDIDRDGDSGPDDRKPVALLFAGDRRLTIANPIDLVLDRFGVTIVGEENQARSR